jgi:hypothetical protein
VIRSVVPFALIVLAGCSSSANEPFFGRWKVASVSTPGVSTGTGGANVVGTEVSYQSGRARFGSETCEGPTYTRRAMSRVTFSEAYRVAPEQLKLPGDPIALVDVLCTSGSLTAGSTFIQRSDSSLVTIWDGVYYELSR